MEDGEQGHGIGVADTMHNEKKEGKEANEEETSFDDEFIKIEKEVMSMKDNLLVETMSDEQPSFTTDMQLFESIPVSEWVEAQEMIKELQIKLGIVSEELIASESEKSKLKVQVERVNEKLQERDNDYRSLEVDLKKLKEEAANTELEHNQQLQLLKETFNAQELKYKEDLLDVREAFDTLSIELDEQRKRMKKLEDDLLSSAQEAQRFEELSREKISQAEQESNKAKEFEKMLEVAKISAKEMETQMCSMQDELKSLKDLLAENSQEKEAPIISDLTEVQEDPGISKSRALVFEEETSSESIDHSITSSGVEIKKTLEYEKMLEVSKLNSAEMEKKVVHLEELVQNLNDKIAEHQQINDALTRTTAELTSIKQELVISKNLVEELEQKSISYETIIGELRKELILHKDSEEKANRELLELQTQLLDLKEEHHLKVANLHDIEIRSNKELKEREALEIILKNLESQIQDLQEQLLKVTQEKEFGENERDDSLQQLKIVCNALEEKLALSEKKFEEVNSILSQSLTEKIDLEQKLNSLDKLHGETLSNTMEKLTMVKDELDLSKNKVKEWEQNSLAEDAIKEELKREVCLYKDSIEQMKKEMLELQSLLTDLKQDHRAKVSSLQDIEHKYTEEFKTREFLEISITGLEKEIQNLQEKLFENGKEKETLEATVAEHSHNLLKTRDACSILEDKLKELELHFSQTLSEKCELEQKLGSLEELHQESSALAKSATQRNFDLEDLIKSSNTAESEFKSQLKEAELRLTVLQQKNTELEEHLNSAELKCSDKEYEVEQLLKKVSELEQKQSSLEESHIKALGNREAEFTLIQEELNFSKNQLVEQQQKSISDEAIIEELKRELVVSKDCEEKAKKELLELQTQVLDLKEEYNVKVTYLQDVELKYIDELKTKEAIEMNVKSLEKEILNLQEQLVGIGKEKKSVEEKLVEHNNNLNQTRDDCKILEERLGASEEQLKEMDSFLSRALSEKLDLEQQLRSVEELHKESATLARNTTQRNFELEDLIKSSSAVESEIKAQMREAELKLGLFQQKNVELEEQLNSAELMCSDKEHEVEQLHKKIQELEQEISSLEKSHEKAFNDVIAELSSIKEELFLSRNQIVEWEQKACSEGELIRELKREISLFKDSGEKAEKEMQELQNQLSDVKEELNLKSTRLQDVEAKYSELLNVKEAIEISLKDQEKEMQTIQEQLEKIGNEKESLHELLSEHDSNFQQHKDAYGVLEEKLQQTTDAYNIVEEKLGLSEEKLKDTDSRLAHTLHEKEELEQKLLSLEELYKESEAIATNATQRNFNLEELIQSSNAAELEAKAQMKETESKLTLLLLKNTELQEHLGLAELKCSERENEVEQLQNKISELANLVKDFEEEKELSRSHMQAYEDKVSLLESSLSTSTTKSMELEQQLKDLIEKCTYHEDEASMSKQRSIELEDLVHAAHSRSKNADSKVDELLIQLESTLHQLQELEEQQRISEAKYKDAEAEVKQLRGSITELSSELEAFRVRSRSLEIALEESGEKEKGLTSLLNAVTDEKKHIEISLRGTYEKSLEDSEIREKGLMQELRLSEKHLEESASRILELESQLESLSKDSEAKQQEALTDRCDKQSQIEELSKIVATSNKEVQSYKDQVAEAAQKITTLQEKVEEDSITHVSLENAIFELKRKVEDTENKVQQSLSENEMMTAINHQLKDELERQQHKIDQLQELLSSERAEKESTADQLAGHIKSLAELTEQHSRGLELHLATETYAKESEAKLQETLTKIKSLEIEFEKKLNQTELEKEGLTNANTKQAQELEAYKDKLHELHARFDEILLEKEDTIEQLHSSIITIENLNMQLTSEGEKFQSQLSPIIEENNLLNEMHQQTKKELNAVIARLEEQLKEEKAKEELLNVQLANLKSEMVEKSEMQIKIYELEQQLISMDKQHKDEMTRIRAEEEELWSKLEETTGKLKEKEGLDDQLVQFQRDLHIAQTTITKQKNLVLQKEFEKEVTIKKANEEFLDERQQKLLLEKYILEIEQQLLTAESAWKEKEIEGERKLAAQTSELKDMESKAAELEKKVIKLEVDLQNAKIINRQQDTNADRSYPASTSVFSDSEDKIVELEKKVMDLEHELQTANTKLRKQEVQIKESKNKTQIEMTSREFALEQTTISKRKTKRRSEGPENSLSNSGVATAEPTLWESLKFVMGIAFFSVIIGIILGKRY